MIAVVSIQSLSWSTDRFWPGKRKKFIPPSSAPDQTCRLLSRSERDGGRERERRQTLSWWKINGRIGQVSTCLPTMTTLINNICQSCQLTLTQRWRFRTQSCVSSVKMNSPSWIWKMPASHSFLIVVRWIYSYNLIVRGLCAHYSQTACVTLRWLP